MGSDHPDTARLNAFTIGDWVVEPKACRVSRGETVVKLRPQLADLLVCLARRAGEIVLKDEILAEVWPGQYIAESGLSRCIAELRQILEDDVRAPRYIETITKRGYRLAAPVVWLESPPRERPVERDDVSEAGVASASTTDPTASAVVEQVAIERAAFHPHGGAPEPAAPKLREDELRDAGSAAKAGRHALRRGRRRRAAWAAAAAVLLASAVTVVLLLLRAHAAMLTERDTVLLADVKNTTSDRVFDDTLRLALAVNLEQAPFLHILPEDVVHAALVRMGRSPDEPVVDALALEVCRREGGAVLLSGSIAPLGSRYAIGIEAVACGSGEAVARAVTEADSKERVLAALDESGTSIRRKLGESRDSLRQHGVPLERATTPSIEALKFLTLGDDNRDHARLADALDLYRRATELDPEFALAWARRGAIARSLELGDEMIPALRRAFELRDRVSQPERFYIEAHYYFSVEGSPEKAMEIYETWKRMYPGSEIPPTNMAGLANILGQYEAAVPNAREAVRLGPGNSIACRNLVVAYLGAGRIDEARQAIADALQHGAGDYVVHRSMLNMALFDRDSAAIEREVQWAAREPATALEALRLRAWAAMGEGRLDDGRQMFSEALARAAEIGPSRRTAEVRLDQAQAEALLGDRRTALAAVEAALAADPRQVTMGAAAVLLAQIGEQHRARAVLDEIARQGVSDPGPLIVSLPSARALLAAMEGHHDEAAAILQPTTRFARGSDFGFVPLGVSALVENYAGRPSNAAAAFRDLIQLRAIEPSSPWIAFARLGLARALGKSGDKPASLAAYDAFLESWKEADRAAPLLDVARRERAAVQVR
jgi:DNA-binding winged helix-turn-helix (wHTH) protein/tetratricopeptide (TPR) repeat protein